METNIIVQNTSRESIIELSIIRNKIYEIRGQKVILDFDLAEMYGVDTKRLKEAVRRNIYRFPFDFMFELSKDEFESLRTQFASSNRGGIRYMPFAFTEQGVAMLASVLNSRSAIEINIQIVRAFIMLRQYALGYAELNKKLEDFMRESNMQFRDIYEVLDDLVTQKRELEKPSNPIGFIKPN